MKQKNQQYNSLKLYSAPLNGQWSAMGFLTARRISNLAYIYSQNTTETLLLTTICALDCFESVFLKMVCKPFNEKVV